MQLIASELTSNVIRDGPNCHHHMIQYTVREAAFRGRRPLIITPIKNRFVPIQFIRRLSFRSEQKRVRRSITYIVRVALLWLLVSPRVTYVRCSPRLHLPTHSCGATTCAPNPRDETPMLHHELKRLRPTSKARPP
jgi:hypothetical protein